MKLEGVYYPAIKKYVMDATISWEERYIQLDTHHVRETQLMMEEIRRLEARINALPDEYLDRSYSRD